MSLITGDACNRNTTFNGARSSTKTFNKSAHHHSQSQWSMGWTEPEKDTPSTSANRFANGSNQNCGNVMTDVPTSRVLAPPGGKSNWSIGGGPTEPAPARSRQTTSLSGPVAPSSGHGVGVSGSANRFASGSNQNCGNFLTDVPTSRVLAPPGGKSNWSIGGGVSAPKPSQSRRGGGTPGRAPAPFATSAPVTGHGVGVSGSANRFASGSNQNCGNFLTDVPTSRVLAPPGGKSNWSIGGGPTEPAPARLRQTTSLSGPVAPSSGHGVGVSGSANRFANGSNQNCGNVLTDVPSSRVLAPPGGKSNWSIGGWSEPAPAASARVTPPLPAPGAAKARSPPKLTETTNVAPAPFATSAPKGNNTGISGSANRFANGANQNCGNFLTDVPSSRVLAPPGGRSSITFG